ncbi:MAG: Hint domain-containing homing endonuclease [Alphaproteobacteria bacterium]
MRASNSRNKRRLLATTSALAIVLVGMPLTVPSLDDGHFFNTAYASSCFVAGTQVLLANGQSCAIERIPVGALVMGRNGKANRVVRVERPRLDGRKLYALNGGPAFVTAEHPFMTREGWKAIDPVATRRETAQLAVGSLQVGDALARALVRLGEPQVRGAVVLAPEPELRLSYASLHAIEAFDADPATRVYNLILDGDHSYFADGYLVHNKGGDDDGGSGGEGGSGSSGSGGGGSGGGEGGSSGGGDSGGSGHGGESGDSGESGESGGSGHSGGSGGSGQSGPYGEAGESGASGGYLILGGQVPGSGALNQVGPNLTREQEMELIGSGWQ